MPWVLLVLWDAVDVVGWHGCCKLACMVWGAMGCYGVLWDGMGWYGMVWMVDV